MRNRQMNFSEALPLNLINRKQDPPRSRERAWGEWGYTSRRVYNEGFDRREKGQGERNGSTTSGHARFATFFFYSPSHSAAALDAGLRPTRPWLMHSWLCTCFANVKWIVSWFPEPWLGNWRRRLFFFFFPSLKITIFQSDVKILLIYLYLWK